MDLPAILQRWKTAHDAAKRARLSRNMDLNLLKLREAQAAFQEATEADPDHLDSAWLVLNVPHQSLAAFYAEQLHPERILPKRFVTPGQDVLEASLLQQLRTQHAEAQKGLKA